MIVQAADNKTMLATIMTEMFPSFSSSELQYFELLNRAIEKIECIIASATNLESS